MMAKHANIAEMKVEVVESGLVVPSEETPKHGLWLSSLDLTAARSHTPIVYYYPSDSDGHRRGDFFCVEKLKTALAKALVPFYPLAGRLGVGRDGRLEIDCNAEGALFVVAKADFAGDCFDHFKPSPEMRRLFVPWADPEPPSVLVMVQVTFLKCGGVVVGTAIHHIPADGMSASHFIQMFTGIARGLEAADAAPLPCHDRTLLRARSPPAIQFAHPEYSSCHLTGTPTPFVARIFTVSKELLASLKRRCGMAVSTYCAITAHVWRCTCIAQGLAPDREARLMVRANVRHRLNPQLPRHYFGNAIVHVSAVTKVMDILSNPIGFAAKKIKGAVDQVDNEFARSAIDFLELAVEKGSVGARGQVPESVLWVNGWLGMPMYDANFGWGNPTFVSRAQMYSSRSMYLTSTRENDGGVTVMLGLEPEHMQRFEKMFYEEFQIWQC